MWRMGVAERSGGGAAASDVGLSGLLRDYRVRRLLSQERLAERSGVSTRTIRDFEAGRVRRPRAESVRLLADGLGLVGWEREQFEAAARSSSEAGRPAVQLGSRLSEDATPRQLPPDVADFVGRGELVAQLRQLLGGRAGGTAEEPEAAAVQRRAFLHPSRDRATVHTHRAQEPTKDLRRLQRRHTPSANATKARIQLPIRKLACQLVGDVDRQGAFAHPGLASHR